MQEMQGTQVWSLGWENLLEEEMAARSGTLAWKIPWTVEPGRLQFMGSQRVGHYLATEQHIYVCVCICRNIYTNIHNIYVCIYIKHKYICVFFVCVHTYIHIWERERERERRKWQPTPVFLPGRSHGPRNLADYSPWGHKKLDHDWATKQQQCRIFFLVLFSFYRLSWAYWQVVSCGISKERLESCSYR